MADIVSTVNAAADPAIAALAQAMGETPEAVRKGFGAAAPAVLEGLIARSQGEDGAAEVRAALADAQTAPALLDGVAGRLDGVKLRGRASGSGLRLLGPRGPLLVEHLAPWAGIKPSSASSLVDLATPLTLAAIRKAGPAAVDTGRLRGFLDGQGATAARALPAGFDPFAGLSRPEGPIAPPVRTPPATAARPWLWWAAAAVVVVLLAIVALILSRGGGGADRAATSPPPPAVSGAPAATAADAQGRPPGTVGP